MRWGGARGDAARRPRPARLLEPAVAPEPAKRSPLVEPRRHLRQEAPQEADDARARRAHLPDEPTALRLALDELRAAQRRPEARAGGDAVVGVLLGHAPGLHRVLEGLP